MAGVSRQRDQLGLYLAALGFAAEVPFKGLNGKRRYRFDFALDRRPDGPAVAVEYDGMGVGHESKAKIWRDQEKSAEAALCGWLLIRCSVKSVEDGRCMAWVEKAMEVETA
jgi:hypothetical protein